MAPLVPAIVSENLSFIFALFAGFGFGFLLEQSGLSSTRKLAGLFYGYDFTVLRVFFTAGITAMFGVLLLSHFELLDFSRVRVNPTFLWSALIGGTIMGIGFVIGGYCPGTGISSAAIGRLDGCAFVLGTILGIFIFIEAYPFFEEIYLAKAMGPLLINEVLGISRILFALVLIIVALLLFYFTRKIENKVNGH